MDWFAALDNFSGNLLLLLHPLLLLLPGVCAWNICWTPGVDAQLGLGTTGAYKTL